MGSVVLLLKKNQSVKLLVSFLIIDTPQPMSVMQVTASPKQPFWPGNRKLAIAKTKKIRVNP